ncbi:MAG: RidA family protein [Acidobacteria bacterium]|nr:RidA family protein [Acidobacteriota bacterium]MBV9622461.1 RidA family protein [Acidobacteriota bacterium]
MLTITSTRRNFAAWFAPALSGFGLATMLSKSSAAKVATNEAGVRKLNEEGKPADGTQMITPIVVHNGLAYIAGVGAHDSGPADSWEIGAHTTKVLDQIKKLVEAAGSSMDDVVQLTVFLAKIDYYDGMNKVFKTYFPHGGPARTTVAVAALPGNSLVEINCIAVLSRK